LIPQAAAVVVDGRARLMEQQAVCDLVADAVVLASDGVLVVVDDPTAPSSGYAVEPECPPRPVTTPDGSRISCARISAAPLGGYGQRASRMICREIRWTS
jgi:hypothetical protein